MTISDLNNEVTLLAVRHVLYVSVLEIIVPGRFNQTQSHLPSHKTIRPSLLTATVTPGHPVSF